MKTISRYIMTLVALLALTTGAWADETLLVTINSTDYASFKSGSKTFDDKVTVTFSNEVYNDGDNFGWYAGGTASLLTVAGTNGYTITSCKFYTEHGIANTGYTVEGESPSVYLYVGYVYTDASQSVNIGSDGVTKIEVFGAAASAASGPEVAWNKAEKTGTFTMPGGNVTLEPEYYPQAALTAAPTAINDVPATTDGAIVKAGTVKNIGETETAQGTVMYYVSTTALDDDALLALAADAWTADVPTAESLAEGPAYVYYYVRGNDSDNDEENFSDGDILAANALTVTIAAEPTYAVTFAEGVNPEPPAEPEWTASPNADVKKGETVTVTYTGSKKVIGVKAEKKAAAAAADEYNEASWDDTNKKLVFEKKKATTTPVSVANSDAAVTWGDGWYTVSGNVTITGNVTLTADAHLILQDGATLTINGQLDCRTNKKNLYIYGQKKGDGKLNVTNNSAIANNSSIAINSDWKYRIDIHGGEVTAASTRNIGLNTGYLAVYGGKLTATSGGGNGINFNNTINVYGGVVEATSNATSGVRYGIVCASDEEILTVYGGKVTATGNGESDDYGNYGSGFRCYVKSGTSGIKFYFSDNGTTWGDGTSYDSDTSVGLSDSDAATKKCYAKAE